MSPITRMCGRILVIVAGVFAATGALAGNPEPIPVPEPATMSLLVAGAAGLYALKKLRNRR